MTPVRLRTLAVPCLLALAAAPAWGIAELRATPAPPEHRIDYLHPEPFRQGTWVDLPLPADRVTLRELRVVTGNRSWRLRICESRSDPATCVYTVPPPGGAGTSWRRDFLAEGLGLPYRDRDGGTSLHLWFDPSGGDWMIFRIVLGLDVD
jgi:hypothetical protein